ncbi:MAG TPA: CRTAC1 family protein [Planctomycetota bacterium]|nr:CRTAC1 family protein [Planctomycetota bacterium]
MSFEDATASWGLAGPLRGIMAHAAACGDIDGDGDLDLFVGNFCDRPPERYIGANGPVPNMLLINDGGKFRHSGQAVLATRARTSGAVFADLDNDGDLDLYVSHNSKARGLRVANQLFENVGGTFRDVSQGNAACVIMGGRSIGVLDHDGDGLLDLLVLGDKWGDGFTRLFRNKGRLAFEDATAKAGLPNDVPGLGVATPDLNGDGWPDMFVSQANRLFLSKGDGTYREGGSQAFQYPPINNEASPCGVAYGDFDRDGDFDIVVVDHAQPARLHLFVNDGLRDGVPRFREASREAGLAYDFPSWTPQRLHLKHAQVEVADMDNDGWPDIVVAATWTADGATRPLVCRNLGRLRFDVPPVEKGDAYFPAGPVADFDRDGRLDLFFAGSLPQMPSKLFLNRSPVKHWLRVQVVGKTLNRMGIGAKVAVYEPGKLGTPEALVGCQEIGTGFGYCTGQEAVAHFGLGELATCDVQIVLPFGKGTIRKPGTPADQLLTVAEP